MAYGYGADYQDADFKRIKGTLAETGEQVEMVNNGYWIGYKGRHISSYVRVDKLDTCQYSMDRHHRFYLETED